MARIAFQRFWISVASNGSFSRQPYSARIGWPLISNSEVNDEEDRNRSFACFRPDLGCRGTKKDEALDRMVGKRSDEDA
jgi:hypothetical protein